MHRNKVYGHLEWATHKSSWRHFSHLLSIASSGVIKALGPPVFFCTIFSTFITVFNHFVTIHQFPVNVPILQVSSLPIMLTSSVLSLLLVFRSNSAYNRFDEARKLWGSNVNRTRNITRQALTWIHNPNDLTKLLCFIRHIKAYSFCLKDHLTTENTLKSELEGFMEPQEIEAIMSVQHRTNYVLQVLSELIHQCNITQFEKITIDENITTFHDTIGGCERIFKTPIPVAYTMVTSRFLIFWHLLLPFALWHDCRWLTIPTSFFMSTFLFYIEEVGVLIEEPFWILPLDSISKGIVEDVNGLVDAHNMSQFNSR